MNLDEYQTHLYPQDSNHLESLLELQKENVYFIGARTEVCFVGIGAVKILGDYGEIKRMYVCPEFRGGKVASLILQGLELHLTQSKICLVRLETGIKQAQAIRFYERHGFKKIGPFGQYKDDPLSVLCRKLCLTKFLKHITCDPQIRSRFQIQT